jgi:hypothetical protein
MPAKALSRPPFEPVETSYFHVETSYFHIAVTFDPEKNAKNINQVLRENMPRRQR